MKKSKKKAKSKKRSIGKAMGIAALSQSYNNAKREYHRAGRALMAAKTR